MSEFHVAISYAVENDNMHFLLYEISLNPTQ